MHVLHTPPVFSYIFLLQLPQVVELQIERHPFSDASPDLKTQQ